ncbi:MAG: copper amine oxidase N-terminal domain-containing protein, partial [Clostridia bacterium]|nr:copper amine oxidase N-terminal domain-containing protein [Clostridia bacterium]
MKKRIISALAALFLMAYPLPMRSDAAAAPKVYINGQRVSGDMPTEIVGGTSYVALKGAGDLMGAQVSWDKASRTADMKAKGLKLTAGEGDIHIEANGRALYAPSGVFIRKGRLMIPCRLLAKAMGGEVMWEASSRSVYITTGSPIAHGDSIYREDELM